MVALEAPKSVEDLNVYLIRVNCPNCGRTYRYASDATELESRCPFSDCALIEEDDE